MEKLKLRIAYDKVADELVIHFEVAPGAWTHLDRDPRLSVLLSDDDDRVMGVLVDHLSKFDKPIEIEWPEPKASKRPRATRVVRGPRQGSATQRKAS